jgi:hypothetical protein
MTNRFEGRCHCGNIALSFETEKTPETLGVRSCGCGFCAPRNARSASDNAGRVAIRVRDQSELSRYRFGEHTADFLICRTCGAYMGAMFTDDDGQAYATLNSRFFTRADEFPERGAHVSYATEDAAAKRARRRQVWTPVVEFRVGR